MHIIMGSSTSLPAPPLKPVPVGKTRICMAAFPYALHGVVQTSTKIVSLFPNQYESWYYVAPKANFYDFIQQKFENVPFPDHLKGHETSPFVWLETCNIDHTNNITPIGGGDKFHKWVAEQNDLKGNEEVMKLVNADGLWTWMTQEMWMEPKSTADIAL